MKSNLIGGLALVLSTALSAQTLTTSGVSFGDVNTGYEVRDFATSITQSTDVSTIIALNSVACPADNDSYIRRFDLDGDHGITTNFTVSSVDFGVETTTGNAGSQTLIANLYSIANADVILLANLTPVGTANVSVTDGVAFIQNVVVTGVVDGSTDDLVVEIVANDTLNGTAFFIGSNDAGQSGPTLLVSAGCGATEPTDIGDLGFPNMHMVMVVNGDVFVAPPAIIPSLGFYGLMLLIAGMLFVYRRKILS